MNPFSSWTNPVSGPHSLNPFSSSLPGGTALGQSAASLAYRGYGAARRYSSAWRPDTWRARAKAFQRPLKKYGNVATRAAMLAGAVFPPALPAAAALGAGIYAARTGLKYAVNSQAAKDFGKR